MSSINTNPINVNYPVPGVNNNSQGFRDNFASIVTNLNTAATEITDLQNNVVVKQALSGTTVNNNMANTLISNASVRGFRSTTYNLGNALSNTVLVDVSLGDVQYGTVAANTVINFGSWAPTGTQSNVQLNLSVSNSTAVLQFSSNVIISNNTGSSTLENFSNIGGLTSITVPYGVTELNYLISTVDCGNTLYITPINRPRVSTAIQQRSPIPTGFQGDVAGDIAVDANYIYVCSAAYDATTVTKTGIEQTSSSGNIITLPNVTSLVLNAPIIFSGNVSTSGIVANTTYYIKTISSPDITISATGFNGTAGNPVAIGNSSTGNMQATSYNGSTIWKRINLATFGATGATGAGATGATGAGATGATGAGATGATGATGAGATGATGPVAGSNTQVIFNDAGNAGATANLTFDKTTNLLKVTTGNVDAASFIGNGSQLIGIAGGLRNLIINGGMQVSQRGSVALTTTSLQYGGADRCLCGLFNFTTASATQLAIGGQPTAFWATGYLQAISGLTTTGTGSVQFRQRIEAVNTYYLNSKTITISGTVYQDTGSTQSFDVGLFKANAADNFSATTLLFTSVLSALTATLTNFTVTYTLGSTDASNGLEPVINFTAVGAVTNKNFYFGNFQLEVGSVATTFEQRPYGLELMLCQRYYEYLTTANAGVSYTITGSQYGYQVQWSAQKRVIPTVTTTYYSSPPATLVTASITGAIYYSSSGYFYPGVTTASAEL